MDILNLLVLFVTVSSLYWPKTDGSLTECDTAGDQCLPIRRCPKYFKRAKNREHFTNPIFREELHRRICKPEVQHDTKTHICCPQNHIACTLNGDPGVCLLREQCPALRATTEKKLLKAPKENLCYAHDQKNYFCCTDPHCVLHRQMCEYQAPSEPEQPATVFQKCSHNGKQGSLVPKKLCDYGFSPEQVNSSSKTVCCVPTHPDQPIDVFKATQLAKMPCGTVKVLNRIQHGTEAQRAEFPWMAYLVYKGEAGTCSGTLVHPSYVLTARHCVTTQLDKVRLGEYDLDSPECDYSNEEAGLCSEPQEISIAEKMRSNSHDIALLRLSQPAEVDGAMVRPICLPVLANLRMHVPPMLTMTGWGLTEKLKLSNVLLKAHTAVISKKVKGCTKNYEICVGGKNHSNQCAGDSGGPYQAPSDFYGRSRFVQYGIISHGNAHCSNPQHPSRGVLVGYVMDWILANMIL